MNKRALVIRLTAMGDVAMTAPILRDVAALNPEWQFDVLTTPFFGIFYKDTPNVSVLSYNVRKDFGTFPKLFGLFRLLKANKYDCVIDLHDVLRSKVLRKLFRMTGVKVASIDKGRGEKKRLTKGTEKRQLKPMTERYREVFEKSGFKTSATMRFLPKEQIPAQFGTKADGERWIGISPFAQHKGKMYPIESVKEVCRILLDQEQQIRLFVFGGGDKEKALATEHFAELPNTTIVIGQTKLDGEMALMSNLDCMLSMDSSNMHIASLYNVRVVSVWCATHIFAGFLGYGQREDDAVGLPLDCRPCSVFGNKPCKTSSYACHTINPKTIANRITGK